MALPTYESGTATVVAGGTNVALTDATTAFNNVFAGDEFCIGTASAKVVDIVDDENFTITPWPGSDETAAAYTVLQDSKLRFTDVEIALDLKKQVQALNATGFEVFVSDDLSEPDPSWGDDGQYAFQPTTGKRWRKDSGVWTYLGISDPAFSRYDFTLDVPNRPASGMRVGRWVAPSAINFPADLLESAGNAATAATATSVFHMKRNGTEFATATFTAGESTATFTNSAVVDFTTGDVFEVYAPDVRDATLADIALTIVTMR